MKNKLIIIPNNLDEIKKLRDVGLTTFLLPITKYSIGYQTFTKEEINSLDTNIYLLINRILTTFEIEKLKIDIKQYSNIKGVFYEDNGVFEILKNENLELINFQTHFNTHYKAINYLFDLGNNSAVIPQDLTYSEISTILDNANKPVCLFLFGKNEVMYSRRLLKSNYQKYYDLDEGIMTITENVSEIKFDLIENEYGTYLFDHNFYNGTELLKLPDNNVKFYIINNIHLTETEVLQLIDYILNNKLDKISSLKDNINNGFLFKETIYKVKGD